MMSAIKPAGQQSNPKTCESLSIALADTYILLLKTQNYHWNVTGPHFHDLHLMLEEQYQALFTAGDEIAERIRALGELAPGTYADFIKLGSMKEGNNKLQAKDMIKDLLASHTHMIECYKEGIKNARDEDDAVSEDMMIGQQTFHEKTHWMLQSVLDGWK